MILSLFCLAGRKTYYASAGTCVVENLQKCSGTMFYVPPSTHVTSLEVPLRSTPWEVTWVLGGT
jgi:hypothetical protein